MLKLNKHESLAKEISGLLKDKKASDVVLLDLRRANPYFCYFLIASANSSVQLKFLVKEMMDSFSDQFPKNHSVRSEDLNSGWVILDFIDVVVHLFLEEQRSYYNLERLWGDALSIE